MFVSLTCTKMGLELSNFYDMRICGMRSRSYTTPDSRATKERQHTSVSSKINPPAVALAAVLKAVQDPAAVQDLVQEAVHLVAAAVLQHILQPRGRVQKARRDLDQDLGPDQDLCPDPDRGHARDLFLNKRLNKWHTN